MFGLQAHAVRFSCLFCTVSEIHDILNYVKILQYSPQNSFRWHLNHCRTKHVFLFGKFLDTFYSDDILPHRHPDTVTLHTHSIQNWEKSHFKTSCAATITVSRLIWKSTAHIWPHQGAVNHGTHTHTYTLKRKVHQRSLKQFHKSSIIIQECRNDRQEHI